MNISVLGAGWYGCHISLYLKALGHQVTMYDHNGFFTLASGFNQNRLHRGFHYPRSAKTRNQINTTYNRFLCNYGNFVQDISENVYAIANDSILDFETYKIIFNGLPFIEISPEQNGLQNVEGSIICDEKLILTEKIKNHFIQKLNNNLRKEKVIELINFNNKTNVNGEEYDLAINCTNNQINRINIPVVYEVALLLTYNNVNNVKSAITIMDGDYASLYPYKENLYTLSSVQHTPLQKFSTIDKAENFIKQISSNDINEIIPKFENVISYFYPNFNKNFTYNSYFVSIKTKFINDKNSTREFVYSQDNKILNMFSGKVNNVFIAEDIVNNFINNILR